MIIFSTPDKRNRYWMYMPNQKAKKHKKPTQKKKTNPTSMNVEYLHI